MVVGSGSPEVDSLGNKFYKNVKGHLHRLDGPAVELVSGDKEWWVDGQWHRLGGPALEWVDGDKWWWAYGKRHRLDGPAIEEANGRKEWWVEGKRMTEEEFRSHKKISQRKTYISPFSGKLV